MKIIATFMAFYLLLGSCFPRTDFSQLLHLKDFIEHYDLHKKEAAAIGETTSLHEFLCIHYFHPDGHEHENGDGQNGPLPCHCGSVSTPVVMAAPQISTSSLREIETPLSISSFHLDQFHLDGFTLIIDHPPAS